MPQLVYIPINAVLFDFDGTMVDTKQYYFELAAHSLQTDPKKLISIADEIYFSKLSPEERNIKWKIVIAIYRVARELGYNRFQALKSINYVRKNHSRLFSQAKPTKDAHIAIKRLSTAGIKLAIISLTSRNKIQSFLEMYLKGSKFFPSDHILAAGEFKSKELAIVHFLRKFNLTETPRSCVIVGDLGGDIIAGKTIGITTFGLTTGYSNYETLEKSSPDAIYETLLEMEKSIHLFLAEER
ncbi:MAG: HAD family hydrolase [Candidatus Hodarchaeota archaeon]